jgi:DNA invertase Pin-like site-specific DNA recombinase
MKNICRIYARLSSRGEEDISTSRQVEMCSAVAKQRGWRIVVYEEPVGQRSGRSERHRPAWKRLREDIAKSDETVALACADVARVSRSVIDFFRLVDDLNRRGIALVSLKEQFDTTTAHGRMILGVISVINQWYAEDISERTKVYYDHLRSAHAWIGKVPQGTRLAGHGTHRHLVSSPATYSRNGRKTTYLETIRAWLRLLTSPQSIGTYSGAVRLNDQGYRWRANDGKPRKLVSSDLRQVNETLSNWDGLIDPRLLARAKERVRERRQHRRNGPKSKFPPPLLAGVLVCHRCGARYTIVHQHRRKRAWTYYRHRRGDCPDEGYVSARYIDSAALAILHGLTDLPPRVKHQVAATVATIPLRRPESDQPRVRASLERKRRRLEEYAVDGLISRDTYLKKRTELDAELAALPEPQPAPAISTAEDALAFITALGDMVERIALLDPYVANRAMRDAFKEIRIRERKVIGYTLSDELATWQRAQRKVS